MNLSFVVACRKCSCAAGSLVNVGKVHSWQVESTNLKNKGKGQNNTCRQNITVP